MTDERDQIENERDQALPDDAAQAGNVASQIEDIPAPDGADVLENLPTEEAAEVVEHLDPTTAAQILTEMDTALAATVVADMEEIEAAMVLGEMDPDDRVDILGLLPKPLRDRLVAEMEPAHAAEVRQLEQYPPDSAGGIMTTEVTALGEDLTVQQAIEELRRRSKEFEQMFYVYVVDQRQHLLGVLSMRDLILAEPQTRLGRIMRTEVDSVTTTVDQETVAKLMQRYGYLAMPVVDERGRLVGIITHDDIVEVIEEEATEDVQRLFGAGPEERLSSPWHLSFRKRIFWLLVNLGTASVAASVVGVFEHTIAQLAILAAYMPIVAGLGGNASAQAMAVVIRGLAVGKVDRRLLRHVMLRELRVGITMGLVVGLVIAVIAVVIHIGEARLADHLAFGAVVGVALMCNVTLACITGSAIPFIMQRLGFDPAQSASIFSTAAIDITGFFILLSLANMFLL